MRCARLLRLGARLRASTATAGAAVAFSRAASTAAPKLAAWSSSAWAVSSTAFLGAALTLGARSAALAEGSPAEEKTYIMVKPDGVHRGLIAEIIARFERKGYKLVGIKVMVPSKELVGKHYAEHDGKPFYPKLVDFLSSGPVVAMVWEGKDVIKYGRTMIGATNPLASPPGTIRGDFGVDVGRNIIHGSDCVESAQREIALWFSAGELAQWKPVATPWVYE